MTNAVYKRLYRQAKDKIKKVMKSGSLEIRDLYIEASLLAKEAVLTAEKKGLSELTGESWSNIEYQLLRGSALIVDDLPGIIEEGVKTIGRYPAAIDENYLISLANDANIRLLGIENLFVGVDDRLLISLYTRIHQDGYTFSSRIWRAGQDYQDKIKRVVELGLSQGRDMIDIARDIDIYVRSDKKTILKQIGKLKRGTSAYAKRIGKYVDYNSIRILRSELYASIQQSTVISGQLNPATTGYYEWRRTFVEDFNCSCPDYEKESPYKAEDVPSYPHSNCSCIIVPVLKDRQEVVNDLETWVNGGQVDYLDDWWRRQSGLLVA